MNAEERKNIRSQYEDPSNCAQNIELVLALLDSLDAAEKALSEVRARMASLEAVCQKPFQCSRCGARASYAWGRSCDVGNSRCCDWVLNTAIGSDHPPLDAIRKAQRALSQVACSGCGRCNGESSPDAPVLSCFKRSLVALNSAFGKAEP